MSITKQRTLDYVEFERGPYVERFNHLPKEEQSKRVEETGFESFRDMLAHILAWWEEEMGIIMSIQSWHNLCKNILYISPSVPTLTTGLQT
jgi:hypothetical protein